MMVVVVVVAATKTCWNVVWLYKKSLEVFYVHTVASTLDNNVTDIHGTSNIVKFILEIVMDHGQLCNYYR